MMSSRATTNDFYEPAQGDLVVTPRYAGKKQQALEAAATVFAEKGYHGATTQDIAEQMGIQQGSLYYYFKSKEQALQQVCEYGFEHFVLQTQAIFEREESFETKLYSIVAAHLSRYRKRNNALKVHNDQRLYLPVERRARLKQLGSQYREQLESVLQQGVEQGVLRPGIDAHFAAYSVIGLCNAWGLNLIRDEHLDLVQVIDRCVDLLLRGVLI